MYIENSNEVGNIAHISFKSDTIPLHLHKSQTAYATMKLKSQMVPSNRHIVRHSEMYKNCLC